MKQLSILFRGTLGFPFPVSGAFALCLLLLASCGGDDSSDESYAAIESASFTFDETTPANNAVRVIANTGWQVFWTPESAAVRVEPASGSGNGVFYVWDMPKGASVQVGVRAASGKTSGKPVTVTRAADAVGVTLSVAPAELLYDPASPASNVVTVTTNASWKAACPNSALKFSPASGTGSATITIADAPAGQRTTLTVTAGEGSGAKTATCVIVRNPETPAETVFSLDFGNGAGGGGQQVDLGTGAGLRWAELPSNFETPSSDQFVHTTWTTTVSGGKRVRNYTYCYDKRRHNPVWVAYPHHRCYLEGSGRSDEPWAADPALPETQQAKIYPSSAGDVYQYWVADLVTGRYGSGYWSRGHLCMSRERPGKGLEINMQTFWPTNIAPQAAEPSPFGKIWGNIEEAISGGAIPADTLYIVAGCYYENDGWVQKDASNNGALSSLSKDCVMPTHQFKMAVRKKTVQVGKPIQECTADELETIAFWVETLTTSAATEKSQLGQFIVPISEIESKMRMKFFPGIPDAAKSRAGTLSAWY